jgi:hypothetical protein
MTLVFEAEDIKYYDSYIDTQWDEQLLKQVEKYSCGVYKFVRLGEDPADVEYKDYAGNERSHELFQHRPLHRNSHRL